MTHNTVFKEYHNGGQKKRNYLKFMSIVLPDGYVLDTIGPYHGRMKDASITKLCTRVKRTVDESKDIFYWYVYDILPQRNA